MGNGDNANSGTRQRSVFPLVILALVVGLGIGFAAGWFLRDGSSHASPELVVQKGSISSLGTGQEKEVFYPRPYAGPPALRISAEDALELIEQRANGFKVRAKPTTISVTNCEWHAEGVLAK